MSNSNQNDVETALAAGRELAHVTSRLADSIGEDGIKVPIALQTDAEGGISVVVLHDVIAEHERVAVGPRRRQHTHRSTG